jgi:hypothetical protein
MQLQLIARMEGLREALWRGGPQSTSGFEGTGDIEH